jgi:hypothetical protein
MRFLLVGVNFGAYLFSAPPDVILHILNDIIDLVHSCLLDISDEQFALSQFLFEPLGDEGEKLDLLGEFVVFVL